MAPGVGSTGSITVLLDHLPQPIGFIRAPWQIFRLYWTSRLSQMSSLVSLACMDQPSQWGVSIGVSLALMSSPSKPDIYNGVSNVLLDQAGQPYGSTDRLSQPDGFIVAGLALQNKPSQAYGSAGANMPLLDQLYKPDASTGSIPRVYWTSRASQMAPIEST